MSFELNHTEVSELTDIRSQLFMIYYDKKNIFVMNNAVVENELLVKGNLYFNDLETSGTTKSFGKVFHFNDTSFCDVSMNSAYMDGDVEITGGVDISNNVQVGGKMSVGKTLNDNYELDVSGDVFISGNLTIKGDFEELNGNTVIDGDLDVSGNLDVSENITIQGNLDVSGNTSINSLKVATLLVDEIEIEESLELTDITITHDLKFANVAASGKSLNLSDDLSCNDIFASDMSINNITVAENFNVSGATTLESTLNVNNKITCVDISSSSNVDIGGNIGAIGNVDISGNVNIYQNTDISGNVDISNNLTVSGETSLQNTSLGLLVSTDPSSNVQIANTYYDSVAGGVFYAKNIGYNDNRIENIYVESLNVDGSHNITEALSSPSFEVNALFISNSGEGENWQGIKDVALDVSGNTYVFGNLSVGRNIAYKDSSNNYDITEYELDISGCTHIDGTVFHTKGTIQDYGNTNQRLPSSMIHYFTEEEVVDALSNTELNPSCRGELILESRHSNKKNDVVGYLGSGIEFRTNDDDLSRWPTAYIMSSTNGFGDDENNYSGGLNFYVTAVGLGYSSNDTVSLSEWNDDNIGSSINDHTGTFGNPVCGEPKLALAMGYDQRLYIPGYVGINVTDPTCNLDIDGSMNLTGTITAGGESDVHIFSDYTAIGHEYYSDVNTESGDYTFASFSHNSFSSDTGEYGILHRSDGTLFLNSPSTGDDGSDGGEIMFRINNYRDIGNNIYGNMVIDSDSVNIYQDLIVSNGGNLEVSDGDLSTYGRIHMYASDFCIWDSSRGGEDSDGEDNSSGRAMVHDNIERTNNSISADDITKANSFLYINYANDFGAGIQLGDSNGYVGIGGKPNSQNEEYTLEVNGETYIGGALDVTDNATISGTLGVTGVITSSLGINVPGTNVLEFGSDQTKENDAGKIGYGAFNSDSLSIVGAGKDGSTRKVRLFDMVGIGKTPTEVLDVDGNALISGSLSGLTSLTMADDGGTISSVTDLTMSGVLTVSSVGKFIGSSSDSSQNEVNDDPGVYIGALRGTYGNLQIVSSDGRGGWIDFTETTSTNVDFEGRIRYGTGYDGDEGMRFYTNGSNERMRIDTAGNVGIGTTSPSYTLDVSGNTYINGDANISGGLTGLTSLSMDETNGGTINNLSSLSVSGFFQAESLTIGSDGTLNIGSITNDSSSNNGTESIILQTQIDDINIQDSNFTTYANSVDDSRKSLCLQPYDGNVGIGTTDPTYRLHVTGDTYISGTAEIASTCTANGFTSTSDERLKTDIKQITNPIDKISNINGVNFAWKKDKTRETQSGLIAQEVEKVIPEVVKTIKHNTSNNKDENELEETKTIDYNGMIGYLVECIKKQQSDINDLRNELQSLKNKSGE